MKPFKPTEIFAINDDLDLKKIELDNGDQVLVIDGFYKDPDAVRALSLDTPAPIWKNVGSEKNGKEYWDCRQQLFFYDKPPYHTRLAEIIEEHFGVQVNRERTPKSFVTNVFKWNIDQPPGSIGNVAHFDSIKMIAANIYLNLPEEQHGGTAFYRFKQTGEYRLFAEDFEMLKNAPEKFMHLAEDGRSYYDPNWKEYWDLERVLEMKYNRVVIYPGYIFHGAYHVDNAFRHYPRITQTCFFDCMEVPNEKNYRKGSQD